MIFSPLCCMQRRFIFTKHYLFSIKVCIPSSLHQFTNRLQLGANLYRNLYAQSLLSIAKHPCSLLYKNLNSVSEACHTYLNAYSTPLDSPDIWISVVQHSTFKTFFAGWVLCITFVHSNHILVGIHENSALIPSQVLQFCTPNDDCNSVSSDLLKLVGLTGSHLESHSGSNSVADIFSSSSFPDASSICCWHIKKMKTMFTHQFLVIMAHFQEVFP